MYLSSRKDKTFEQAFEEFLIYKRANNVRPKTLESYQSQIFHFLEFYGKEGLCKDISEATVQDYLCYLQKMPKKQNNPQNNKVEYLSSVTIATYIRHLRAVLYYLMKRGEVKRFEITIPKVDKEVKEPYTAEELKLLLKKPDMKTCSFSEYRCWVMTNYFLSTANRLSTVINLRIKDLNFEENEIYLRHTKNRSSYTIPMQRQLKRILLEYLSYRKGEPDDYLFCSENDDKKPLKTSAVTTAMARYNHKRGVMKTSVHIYRNTFAKHWILHGGDLIRLQKILGHKTLSMVLEYVDMYGKDLKLQFDELNPLTAFTKGNHISLRP